MHNRKRIIFISGIVLVLISVLSITVFLNKPKKTYATCGGDYTFGWDSYDDTGVLPNGQINNSAPFPTPVADGYSFVGWYLDSALTRRIPENISTMGALLSYFDSINFCSGDVISAWRANGSSPIVSLNYCNTLCDNRVVCDVRFSYNYTLASPNSGSTVSDTTPIPLPAVSSNYTFEGFYLDANYTKKVNGSTFGDIDESLFSYTTHSSGCRTKNIPIYARIIPGTYTVKYNGNGATGGSMSNSTYTVDVEGTLRANAFTRTGFTFAGWSKTANGTKAYDNRGAIWNLGNKGATVNLYAIWTAKEYTVHYYPNNGTGSMSNSQHTYNVTSSLRSNTFSRPGYAFAGWATTPAGSVVYANQQNMKNVSPSGETLNLYAVWSPLQYSVRYNNNGGAGTMSSSTHTYKTSGRLSANTFTRTGQMFLGWATNATGDVVYIDRYDMRDVIPTSTSMILYAVWGPQVYEVVFNANGGTGSMSKMTFTYGQTSSLSANTFTRSGYTFAGWATSATGAVSYNNQASTRNIVPATSTLNLYAVWTPNSYSVIYNANGGTGTMSRSTHTYGVAKNLSANAFSRIGYTFAGWSTDSNGTAAFSDNASVSNLTTNNNVSVNLYAIWTANTYKVKYNANGGTGTMVDSTHTYNALKALNTNTFTREEYRFIGWAMSATGNIVFRDGERISNLSRNNNGEITLYAVWQSTTITCPETNPCSSIIFNTNGGNTITNYQKCTPATSTSNNSSPLPVPARTGYEFVGWYADQTLETRINATTIEEINTPTITDSNNCITGYQNVNLYAKWEESVLVCAEIEKCFDLTFNTIGGNSITPYHICQNTTSQDSLPVPTKDGYAFAGWYSDAKYNQLFNAETLKNLQFLPINNRYDCLVDYTDYEVFAKWDTSKLLSLKGYVVDQNRKGLKDYKVTLHSDPITVTTNENGYFEFNEVPNGNHKLVITNINNEEKVNKSIILDSSRTSNYDMNIIGYQGASNNTIEVVIELDEGKSTSSIKPSTVTTRPVNTSNDSPGSTPSDDNPDTIEIDVIKIYLLALVCAGLFIYRYKKTNVHNK